MSIYSKLAAIQKDLIAPKGQTNSFGKYNYRSCEDILKALKPLCDENGCVTFITNDLQEIGGRVYVKATVTLVDLETGESITSTAQAREEEIKKGMDGSQITGASSSYARKYALAGMFCIDNEKDSDATNKGDSPTQPLKPVVIDEEGEKPITKKDAEMLRTMFDKHGIKEDFVLGLYNLKRLEDANKKKYSNMMRNLENIKDRQIGEEE